MIVNSAAPRDDRSCDARSAVTVLTSRMRFEIRSEFRTSGPHSRNTNATADLPVITLKLLGELVISAERSFSPSVYTWATNRRTLNEHCFRPSQYALSKSQGIPQCNQASMRAAALSSPWANSASPTFGPIETGSRKISAL